MKHGCSRDERYVPTEESHTERGGTEKGGRRLRAPAPLCEILYSHQQKSAGSLILATLLAPTLLVCLLPASFAIYLPLMAKLCILAATWFAVFKLVDVAWDHLAKKQVTQPTA